MKKVLQLIRPFCETRNIVALCLAMFLCAGSLWAQTDYSTTYTSGVTLSTTGGTSASTCDVVISGTTYAGLKAGTSKTAGAVQITVPENTKYLHMHIAAWNNETVSLAVTPTGYSGNIALTSNSGIANNSPFTFNGDASTSNYYKVITFSEPLSTATTLTFTATSGKRFVVWGVNAEEEGSSDNPSITASNVELPYNATSGEIEYDINNPTPDGVLSASTTTEWISDITLLSSAAYVTFTTTANNSAAQRTGTVTLTYAYGDNQTVTKNVTVTQAGNPNAVDNISDITSAGTYTVQGTIVAKSARGFIVGDGTGYVYYYNQNYTQADYNIGDIVKLSGSVTVYGGVFEFNNSTTITAAQTSNYVAETPTLLTGADMDARVASTTPPALSSYVQYQGTLSIDGTHYNITDIDGATTAIGSISYPLNTDFTSLDGSTVIVEGYYVGISTSTYYNTMLGSITEVVTDEPSISASNVEIAYDVTSGEIEFTINNAVEDGVLTAATEAEWLSIGEVVTTVPFYCDPNPEVSSRTATVTLTYTYGDDQTVTKNVTVTQASNPNVINTISDITTAGTYTVQGTIVAKSTRGFIVGDGTGYVYYYNQNYTQADYNIGDMVKLSGSVVAYGGVFEFNASTDITAANESNYEEEEPIEITGAEMDARVASTTPAALSSYVQYQGTLSVSGTYYNITGIEGATNAKGSVSFPLNTDFTSLNGHTVIVKGYYVGVSSSQYYNTMIGSITEVASDEPSITLNAYEVSVDAEDHEGTLTVTYTNIDTDLGADIYWYDATGALVNGYDWIEAEIDGETLSYTIAANDGEARTAYFKVYAVGVDESDVYSNIVTVNQAQYVVDYATLPFEFDGGRADIANTVGLTHEGLDSDYSSSPKLKFKNQGSWLILHFNETPGTLTFDIKGNSFADGTFTVQTSEDGETYTDLATYTELTTTVQNEEFTTLGANVRYIKWVYTEKITGNVALGNITLAQPNTNPVITVTPALVEISAGQTNGTLTITHQNMGEEPLFDVEFYGEDGESPATYSWIEAEIDNDNNIYYVVDANNGEARTAYLKVYGLDEELNEVYSNLVTITQAAAPQQYNLTISEFENLEIFTFVDNLSEPALEGSGSISVNENATVSLSISAEEGYIISSLVVDGQNVTSQIDETGMYVFTMPAHNVTVSATAVENVPGNWVLTDITDLTENDVFVIVETKEGVSHAMANDNGTSAAPAAVSVTVVENTLSGEPAANLQWNISVSDEGYTFYPNGNDTTWLYAFNNNNGLRVGDSDAKLFTIDAESGYLVHVGTGRYIGVYLNNPDWRCYTTINSNIEGQTFSFYKKVTSTTPTQTIALAAGTNWVSFNVETNLNDLKAALVATGNTTITIQGQTQNATYNPSNGRWTGQLRALDLSQMYMIKLTEPCEITLEGMLVDPSMHPVTIAPGANYIAYPFNTSMTLTNAFAGFGVANDQVQSQLQNANYSGTRWTGQLRNLDPGKGYIYKSASTETRTFTFPSGN